jgi:LacI family transcriptional regulator
MAVTLKQIANELNVSHVTVANALNGKAEVSEAMRLRVQETALRLGYNKNANHAAKAMIARRYGRRVENGAIALIHNIRDRYPWHSIPYYRSLLDGVGHEAGLNGVDLYIVLQHSGQLPRAVKERRVDGAIFLGSARMEQDELRELGLPAASLGSYSAGMFSVLPDGEHGFYQATKYLIELGHRNIAYIGGKSNLALERLKGYKRALVEHGLPINESLIQYTDKTLRQTVTDTSTQASNPMELEGRGAIASLLQRTTPLKGKPSRGPGKLRHAMTAVVCQNDIFAIGAVRGAESLGLKVPDDLSVIGFDDVSLDYSFQPALTSVSYPSFDMGRRAMQWINQEVKALIANQGEGVSWESEEKIEYFPTTIAVRDSTRSIL